jgi:membrane protease YdiL (CAAX protease family)
MAIWNMASVGRGIGSCRSFNRQQSAISAPHAHSSFVRVFPSFGFHLFSALTVGITAGFCEEVLYRAFLMTEFAEAGYNQTMQVVLPGLVFGLSTLAI